jgi:hypothetical protein
MYHPLEIGFFYVKRVSIPGEKIYVNMKYMGVGE